MSASRTQNTSKARFRRSAFAGGAAVLLLAGGGATWAGWNNTSQVGSGNVTTGSMNLAVNSPSWQLCRQDSTTATTYTTSCSTITNPTSVTLVPGDQLTYTASVVPTLVGTNLKANLTSTAGAQTVAPLQVSDPTLTGASNPLSSANSGNTYSSSMTITFPWGSATTNEGQNITLDLTKITFTLAQVL